MFRTILLTTFALLIGVAERARADFAITADQTTFVSNDSAPWIRNSSSSNSYSTTAGLGVFSFNFNTNSVPFTDSLVSTVAGNLFVGVSSSGGGGIASYTVNTQFDFGTRSVLGFGFVVDRVGPETVLRAFDNTGGFQDYTLAPGTNLNSSGRGFVGITSNVPITGFRFSESVTDSTAVLGVNPVQINAVTVAVPAPAGFIPAFLGAIFLGYVRRGRKQS